MAACCTVIGAQILKYLSMKFLFYRAKSCLGLMRLMSYISVVLQGIRYGMDRFVCCAFILFYIMGDESNLLSAKCDDGQFILFKKYTFVCLISSGASNMWPSTTKW